MHLKVFILGLVAELILARPEHISTQDIADKYVHESFRINRPSTKHPKFNEAENTHEFWINKAQLALMDKINSKTNTNIAKNVIFFLGDGMSIPTLSAARLYEGQLTGETGEETYLSFEEFPHTALSKTYCVDSQVADSACSATAYLGGVKGNIATIGVTGAVSLGDCQASTNKSTHVSSIGRWSQLKEKWTGIVTTTRVTEASPAGVYANIADRDWESDKDLHEHNINPSDCPDIAHQLIHGETGKNLRVILGGGRQKFLPNDFEDEEGETGDRLDGRNLIEEWKEQKENTNAEYVWDRNGLLNVDTSTDYLLGLFEASHCMYNLDRTDSEPTLAEMTEAAIKILSKSYNGFFLFVEGGLIDVAHHANRAQRSLDETVQFSEAIRKAREITSVEDTLIVVTSDHSHTISVNGYPTRGTDILGISGIGKDNLPYATISYSNGPGYRPEKNEVRHDIREDDMHHKDYSYPSMVPLDSETHGGDDVGIFASGPWSHLFSGVLEQNFIPHIVAYAACVGDGITACDE